MSPALVRIDLTSMCLASIMASLMSVCITEIATSSTSEEAKSPGIDTRRQRGLINEAIDAAEKVTASPAARNNSIDMNDK